MSETKPKILIVDDTPLFLRAVSMHLEKLGYDFLATRNYDDALGKDSDIAFIDLDLGDYRGRSGIDLSRELREKYPWTKRVDMSGVMDYDGQKATEDGDFEGCIEKNLSDIARKVEELNPYKGIRCDA